MRLSTCMEEQTQFEIHGTHGRTDGRHADEQTGGRMGGDKRRRSGAVGGDGVWRVEILNE